MIQTPTWEILQGDALQIIPTFAPNTFDAVITDPPASMRRTWTWNPCGRQFGTRC